MARFPSVSFALTEAFCLLMLVPHSQAGEQALKTAGFWQKLESQMFLHSSTYLKDLSAALLNASALTDLATAAVVHHFSRLETSAPH